MKMWCVQNNRFGIAEQARHVRVQFLQNLELGVADNLACPRRQFTTEALEIGLPGHQQAIKF